MALRAIMARPRRVRTTDSHHDLPIAPKLLERSFIADAPNQIWLADITYIETGFRDGSLAAIMDLHSRRIVGWAMRDHLRTEPPLAGVCGWRYSTRRPAVGLCIIPIEAPIRLGRLSLRLGRPASRHRWPQARRLRQCHQ